MNTASAAKQTHQISGLQQDVFVPVKISKRKTGSRAYFMDPSDYYVITPLSKLLAKAYLMEKRMQQDTEYTFQEFEKVHSIGWQDKF